ncbi:MAG: holo-ACP synthase [Magnetococcales bacterium]|nr:holo-ACP synthase [Magnetococcales bacterium]
MIVGIGTDAVDVRRIRNLVDRFGRRFLERTFTPAELALCRRHSDPAPCLAKRFAAKEALVKALGCGFRGGIRLHDVEALRDEAGRPRLVMHGAAARRAEQLAVSHTHLTLSDEGELALAFVVVESRNG